MVTVGEGISDVWLLLSSESVLASGKMNYNEINILQITCLLVVNTTEFYLSKDFVVIQVNTKHF